MGNAEYDLLALAHNSISGITAEDVVNSRYKTSKQPMKKMRTFYRHLRSLEIRGWLRSNGGKSCCKFTELRFTITPVGLFAGRHEMQYRTRYQSPRPIMRLVTD